MLLHPERLVDVSEESKSSLPHAAFGAGAQSQHVPVLQPIFCHGRDMLGEAQSRTRGAVVLRPEWDAHSEGRGCGLRGQGVVGVSDEPKPPLEGERTISRPARRDLSHLQEEAKRGRNLVGIEPGARKGMGFREERKTPPGGREHAERSGGVVEVQARGGMEAIRI